MRGVAKKRTRGCGVVAKFMTPEPFRLVAGHVSLFPRHFEKLMLIPAEAARVAPARNAVAFCTGRGTIIRAIREIMQNARRLLARAPRARQARGLTDEGMQMITRPEG